MATNTNTQHITTFSGGMNTDTSDAYLDKTAYRMAKNLRYITNLEENSGELHMIEGAVKVLDVNENVIATTTLRDTGILVTEHETGWSVYVFNSCVLNRVAHINDTTRVVGRKLSLVTRYEDNDNQKLYIADGAGPLIVIQLNIDNEETDLNRVLSIPAVNLPKPLFCGLIGGSLKAGLIEYSYQLYIKHGPQTEVSVSTKLIPLHTGNPKTNSSNRIEGYESGKTTNKGIKIRIENIPDRFDYIKVYRITYVENGQQPTIELVYNDKFNKNVPFEFMDTGLDAMEVLSLEEYNSMTGIHIVPKVIESKDDYMFAANIRSDNPIYDKNGYIRNYSFENKFEWGFCFKKLVGDLNTSDDSINYIGTSDSEIEKVVNEEGKEIQYDTSVVWSDESGDYNNTYANPRVSYAYKSLRRGERYRYGIVLYDKFGNATGVKHLIDIDVPENIPTFEYIDGKLNVISIGVWFSFSEMPDGVTRYEIVRCGRGESDIKNVCQGVLARPVRKFIGTAESSGAGSKPRIDETYPLTPTGWMTTDNFYTGYHDDGLVSTRVKEFIAAMINSSRGPKYVASQTNMSTKDTDTFFTGLNPIAVNGNYNIYQLACPEICYLEDSTKDVLSAQNLKIKPLYKMSPTKYELVNTSIQDNTEYKLYNFGNVFANLPIMPDGVFLDTRWGTSLAFYVYPKYVLAPPEDKLAYMVEAGMGQKTMVEYDMEHKVSYVKLYNSTDVDQNMKTVDNVPSIGFPQSLGWDDYADAAEPYMLKYMDKVTAVGGTNFTNWVSGGCYGINPNGTGGEGDYDLTGNSSNFLVHDNGGLQGPGGKCVVIQIENGEKYATETGMSTYLCTLQKDVNPYGGNSDIAKQQSIYRSYGDIFQVNPTSNEVVIFDGDTFIMPFEYVSMHKYAHGYIDFPRTNCIIYSFPVETSINLAYTYGYEYSKNKNSAGGDISYLQINPSNVNGKLTQEKPLYQYSSAYSVNDYVKSLVAESIDDDDYDTNLDYRVYHSMIKANNEKVDNWLKFQPASYLDVDTRKGPITGLRRFHNNLVFWQTDATGLLSVNERTTISDDSNLPLILGTGGVLARHDYLATSNGMKEDEYADTQSNTTLYWWDHSKDEICAYSGGQEMLVLSKVKFVQNYINSIVADEKDIEKPILSFDSKFNEALFTISDETLVYNEHLAQFTSVYDIHPKAALEFPDKLYFVGQTNSIEEWNKCSDGAVNGLDGANLTPYLKYVVNDTTLYTKVFDNAEFAGRVYGGDREGLEKLTFKFSTPLKQHGELTGDNIMRREYNFRYVIPRDNGAKYGDRLRGKTMQCEIISESNLYDFSLQFIINKYRISWS